MKASIRDVEVLRSIDPFSFAAYLRSHQWYEVEQQPGRYAVWVAPQDSQIPVEVLVPLNRDMRDYANRMAEALQALEAFEQRSQIAILQDIQTSSADVIRLGAEGEEFRDGTLPIKQGIEFLQAGRELLLAAACGAAQPQEIYTLRKPKQAEDYIKSVRLGQSERGSYVFSIHSPLVHPPNALLVVPKDEPFARRVTRTLMRATSVIRDTASRSAERGGVDAFIPTVKVGVSANLCDAIVKLHEGTEASSIRLQMSWATNGYEQPNVVSRVIIPSDIIPIIREAGLFLRSRAPATRHTLQGNVHRLDRMQHGQGGRIFISENVPGGKRRVQVDVNEDDYRAATTANVQNWQVRCEGLLMREGRHWVLYQYYDFQVLRTMV